MMKKLKILLAATGSSSLSNDIYLNELAKKLRRNHRVWLVKINPQTSHKGDIPVSVPEPKPKILWLFYLLCPYLWDKRLSRLVNKAIRKTKISFDIISFELPSFTLAYQKKNKEKLIVRGWYYPHNLWQRLQIMWPVGPRSLFGKLIFIIRQFWYYQEDDAAYKMADQIVTLTPKLAKYLSKKRLKAVWSPLGKKVGPLKKRKKKTKVRFGCVANDLELPRKGILLLLKAVKIMSEFKLASGQYQIELIGNYTSKLPRIIKKLGIERDVFLTGFLPNQQVLKKLQNWNVFVFPSLFEEIPRAVIEAMAGGLPVIAWQIEGLEAACGHSQLLLPKGNIKLMAQAMAKMINEPSLREKLSYLAWKRARKYFSWQTILPRLERIFQENERL